MRTIKIAAALIAGLAFCPPAMAAQTKAQAAALAKIHTVAVLAGIKDTLYLRKAYVMPSGQERDDFFSISDWDINPFIVDQTAEIAKGRLTVAPLAYDPKSIATSRKILGAVPRSVIPPAEGIDAYIVIWGELEVLHGSALFGSRQLEFEQMTVVVDVIDAKTKKTLQRHDLQAVPPPDVKISEVMSPIKKVAETDFVADTMPSAERRERMKADYKEILQRGIAYTLKDMKLAN